MTAAPAGGAPLAHLRWGDTGPWVLLLHGIGGGREAWSDALSGTGSALGRAGYRAVAIDFPGYGLSPPIEPFDLAGMAASVLALLDWLRGGPQQTQQTQADRVALVGHSMGGMVAQELVARWPERVHALVLAGTSPAFGKPGGEWQQAFLTSRFAPLDAGLGMGGLAAQLVPAMVAPGMDPARMAAAQAMMAAVPQATYRLALNALVAFDQRAGLAKIRVPTLVVTGEKDSTAAPEVARRMAERIAGSQLAILAGAGHLLNLERPEAFNAVLLKFLRESLP